MRVVFTEFAKQELDNAVDFYNQESSDLGKKFSNEVKMAVHRITHYPHAWSLLRGEVRKCLLHAFPYNVLYSVEKDHILIIAIAHQHREPDYWIDRNAT
ncbi:MAG: type II toxin-antitoxin system RelE/ParE family toxin [Candidatus Hinthialibacter antarcticus]|nr:type II toxin-antitoxin system RelE/ParE family toxin [Candidatus Hinthialibacter antarcticus]